eukprot:5098314-Prymnesium_polylepis.1
MGSRFRNYLGTQKSVHFSVGSAAVAAARPRELAARSRLDRGGPSDVDRQSQAFSQRASTAWRMHQPHHTHMRHVVLVCGCVGCTYKS